MLTRIRFARDCQLDCADRTAPPPHGAIAQLGERLDRTQEVASSSLASSTSRNARKSGRFVFRAARGYWASELGIKREASPHGSVFVESTPLRPGAADQFGDVFRGKDS